MVGLPHEGLHARRSVRPSPPVPRPACSSSAATSDARPRCPRLVAASCAALAAPRTILVAMDEEGGFVSQLAPDLPCPPPRACSAAPPSETRGRARSAPRSAAGCARSGVDINFAPVLDVDSRAAQSGDRAALVRSDPHAVARAWAAAVLRGCREGGVLACTKHFPGHGATATTRTSALPVVRRRPRDTRDARARAVSRALNLAPLRS